MIFKKNLVLSFLLGPLNKHILNQYHLYAMFLYENRMGGGVSVGGVCGLSLVRPRGFRVINDNVTQSY